MSMIDLRELYWAAGFLEGEGCFSRGTPKQPSGIQIRACQVNPEPLVRLQKCLGGAINGPHRGHRINQSPIYDLAAYSMRAAALMMTLFCLMSQKRQGQMRIAIEGWRKTKPRQDKRKFCPHGHPYDEANTVYRLTNGGKYLSRGCRECGRLSCIERRTRLAIAK